ncbi:hypothetical protein HDV01_007919 [Terramyces sp. JEL0728]|nr:hypothetical protein HDV01_007919 [Terramyces sp. JEL0728]
MIEKLPSDILVKVIAFVSEKELSQVCRTNKQMYQVFKSNEDYIRRMVLQSEGANALFYVKKFMQYKPTNIHFYDYYDIRIFEALLENNRKLYDYVDLINDDRKHLSVYDERRIYRCNIVFQWFDSADLIKAFVLRKSEPAETIDELFAMDLERRHQISYTSSDETAHFMDYSYFRQKYLRCLAIKFPAILNIETVSLVLKENLAMREMTLKFWDGRYVDPVAEEDFHHEMCDMVLGRIQNSRMDRFGIRFYNDSLKIPEGFPLPIFNCEQLVGKHFEFNHKPRTYELEQGE